MLNEHRLYKRRTLALESESKRYNPVYLHSVTALKKTRQQIKLAKAKKYI